MTHPNIPTRPGEDQGLDLFQATIGYRFQDKEILLRAFTHRSFVNEQNGEEAEDNERLEFLGDAVLSLVVGHYLMDQMPQADEGTLSKERADIVNEASLATLARSINLGSLLLLGRGEESSGGREKSSLLACAMEALIGGIYLDGGFDQAQEVILRVLDHALALVKPQVDYKSKLVQWAQKRHGITPDYEVMEEMGPSHRRIYRIAVKVKGRYLGQGTGSSKKAAHQQAARQALRTLKNHPEEE